MKFRGFRRFRGFIVTKSCNLQILHLRTSYSNHSSDEFIRFTQVYEVYKDYDSFREFTIKHLELTIYHLQLTII